jgi:hypothetical protein
VTPFRAISSIILFRLFLPFVSSQLKLAVGSCFLSGSVAWTNRFRRLRLSNDCLTLSRLVTTHPPASHDHLAAHHIHQHNAVNTHHEHTSLTPRVSPCPTHHIHATYTHSSSHLIAITSSVCILACSPSIARSHGLARVSACSQRLINPTLLMSGSPAMTTYSSYRLDKHQ